MTVLDRVREVGSILRDLLYPPLCVGCDQVGSLFCAACRDAVRFVPFPVCPLCGRPRQTADLCHECAAHPLHIGGIRSAVLFEEPVRSAIHGLKYNHVRDLVHPLGDMLVFCWEQTLWSADRIVPVPLHPRRERGRGYNQATLLAEHLSRATGLGVDTKSLQRRRHTPSQTGLGPAERRANVLGAFTCLGSGLRGVDVLLIDDVCTTGATLEACSAALHEAGACSVRALTVARAV